MSTSLRHGSQAIDILFFFNDETVRVANRLAIIHFGAAVQLEGENLFLFSFSTCACVITY